MNVMREEREERRERAVAPGAVFSMPQHWRLCHICGGHPASNSGHPASNKKSPLTRAFSVNNLSVNNLRSFSRAAQRFDYLKLPQKRWMRLQASSRSEVLV